MINEKIMYLYDFMLILRYKKFVSTKPDECILQDLFPEQTFMQNAYESYESQGDKFYLEMVNEVPCLIMNSSVDQRILFFHPDCEQMATPAKMFINHNLNPKDNFWDNRYVKYHRESGIITVREYLPNHQIFVGGDFRD